MESLRPEMIQLKETLGVRGGEGSTPASARPESQILAKGAAVV